MDLNGKRIGAVTPVKDPQSARSKFSEKSRHSENSNPNVTSPVSKISKSPAIKSAAKPQKPTDQKHPNPLVSPSPRNKIRERKFLVAKKNLKREKAKLLNVTCKCKAGTNSDKCLCVAYETLRASQEEFFSNRSQQPDLSGNEVEGGEEQEKERIHNLKMEGEEDGFDADRLDRIEGDLIELSSGKGGSTTIKRRRAKLLEEARQSVPETGSGRVMHLVQAFEKLLTIPKSTDTEEKEDEKEEKEEEEEENAKKGMKWELPGLRPKAPETQVSSSSFCPSDFFLTSESLGLDSRVCSSLDSGKGSFSISNRTSGGGRRSRRHSSESSGTFGGRQWKRRQLKTTSQRPFKLRTEKRGRSKEEEFVKKVQQMMMEEEKQRIPVAQGLPWTTDEPECLAKPPVKESTRPIDLVLHSDVRAVERAEFDNQVQEKLSLIEQYKMERDRQQKLAEEEELRRLRKELVPRAQPMPYFDRPFIPRRSEKHPTIPKEPKFHAPQHKKIKCCMSWNDMYTHQH